jgi:hypothetical protein
VVLAISGVLLAPSVMPVLPPAVYEQSSSAALQADRFGWEEQVALIAQVYHGLPLDEQRVACIFTFDYGEAGALVQFGGAIICPHRSADTTPSISGDRKGVPARSSSRSIGKCPTK